MSFACARTAAGDWWWRCGGSGKTEEAHRDKLMYEKKFYYFRIGNKFFISSLHWNQLGAGQGGGGTIFTARIWFLSIWMNEYH